MRPTDASEPQAGITRKEWAALDGVARGEETDQDVR